MRVFAATIITIKLINGQSTSKRGEGKEGDEVEVEAKDGKEESDLFVRTSIRLWRKTQFNFAQLSLALLCSALGQKLQDHSADF